ncbi:MAG: ATP-binding protein [Magnetococcales bacterium]|nr:ATP-binding protein [Magnetococcales bacterium]
MKKTFVHTQNAHRFTLTLDGLLNRGAEEACIMVVDGKPGLGKTRVLERWAIQQEAVYIRAMRMWKPAWMVRDLLDALDPTIKHARSMEHLMKQCRDAIKKREQLAERDGLVFAVVIDEIDHVVKMKPREAADVLESLRDLTDTTKVPFILVGMGEVRDGLAAAYPQIMRRSRPVRFQTVEIEDVRKLVDAMCEVDVKDDLVAYLHTASRGFVGEIMEGIKAIERQGRRNRGKPMDIPSMRGQELMTDRRSGMPIKVK